MVEYPNIFKGILDQLKKVDVHINEENKVLLLLASLVDSFVRRMK